MHNDHQVGHLFSLVFVEDQSTLIHQFPNKLGKMIEVVEVEVHEVEDHHEKAHCA